MKRLIFLRKSLQFFFLCGFIYLLWSTTYPLKGKISVNAFFVADPLIMFFISLRNWPIIISSGIYAIGILSLTIILGRFFCGWICPLGTIMDITDMRVKNRKIDFIYVKYYILACIFISGILGFQIFWIFDPIAITARFISLNLIPYITFSLNKAFIFFIQHFNFSEPIYDFYRFLKSGLFGIQGYYFSHSSIVFISFIAILILSIITKRFWCRVICPLGALFGIISKFAFLERYVEACSGCLRCVENCPMSAINHDMRYKKEECILCMNCIYDCPTHTTQFRFRDRKAKIQKSKDSISRQDFLFLMSLSIFSISKTRYSLSKKVIRPPGVKYGRIFLDRCIRCGNCMKVCPTNGLQPSVFEAGFEGLWTPRLIPEIGWCEYNCNLCGKVCPTQAIPALEISLKQKTPLGLAFIDRSICIAWAYNKECIVCEEHCPVPTKAIKLDSNGPVMRPMVEPTLCVGCGICQNKCPVRPVRAIRVEPL